MEEYWSSQKIRPSAKILSSLDLNRVYTLDRLLDKCRVGTGELQGAEALAGVQIFQHVQ
jgi:hypothetical protein